jgi:hypothetical protein
MAELILYYEGSPRIFGLLKESYATHIVIAVPECRAKAQQSEGVRLHGSVPNYE